MRLFCLSPLERHLPRGSLFFFFFLFFFLSFFFLFLLRREGAHPKGERGKKNEKTKKRKGNRGKERGKKKKGKKGKKGKNSPGRKPRKKKKTPRPRIGRAHHHKKNKIISRQTKKNHEYTSRMETHISEHKHLKHNAEADISMKPTQQ